MPKLVSDVRKPDHPVDPVFVHRHSPRALSAETLSEAQLMTLLEAARWAPSSYNEQPWRFMYGKRGTAHFDLLFSFLMEANQVWCKNAAALILIASKKTFTRNGSPNSVRTFDCGSAWENLALQATQMGIIAHGMAGFDRDKARQGLGIPADFDPEAMIALGRPGKIEDLPEDLRKGEEISLRKPIAEWAWEGKFKSS